MRTPGVLRRAGRGERGAVAVEAAFVLGFVTLLLLGMIETAYLIRDSVTVSAAARAGARMGASDPRGANFALNASRQVANAISGLEPARIQKVWVYRATPTTGLPDSGSFASCSVCVQYAWSAATGQFVQTLGAWSNLSQNACAGDPNRNALGVYVEYRHHSLTGAFFEGRRVAESTVMLLEPLPTSAVCHP